MKVMQTQFKQMQLKLSSMEQAQLELEDQARYEKLNMFTTVLTVCLVAIDDRCKDWKLDCCR